MATPLSADALVKALKGEGLTVKEYKSWRTHNRAGHGAWGPVNGVMIHHTAGSSNVDNAVKLCYDGRSDLPGPLCHAVIDKAGVVHLVGNGRANHAGLGDNDTLAAVIDERKPGKPNKDNTDGNARFYGFECINLGNGKDPWPAKQVDAMVRASAAICRAYGWTGGSVIGHLEWTATKIDPKGFAMDDFRKKVNDRLGKKPVHVDEKPKPVYAPFPGAKFFYLGKKDPLITAMGKALVKAGYKGYKVGPGPEFTRADIAAVKWFQKKQGWTGSDADGYPGPETWKRLKVTK